jgi:hypothetical protein
LERHITGDGGVSWLWRIVRQLTWRLLRRVGVHNGPDDNCQSRRPSQQETVMKKTTIANKPLLAALLAVAATCSASHGLYAAEPQTAAEPGTAAGAAPTAAAAFPPPAEVVSRLQIKLSLSADQASAITPIVASRQERLKAVLSDTGARPLKRRRELREIVADSDKQINALLTPEQQKQYAEIEKQLHEELKQRMRERRNADAG